MAALRKAIVIHSPHSGRSTQLPTALTLLQQAGIEIVRTQSIAVLDNLPAQGNAWREEGIELAIAAGGDGLVGGVITHIAESSLPLGIIPLGTANDIARSVTIPQDIEQAIQVIAQGKIRQIDIGTAKPAQQKPHQASPHPDQPTTPQIPSQKQGFFAHALTVGLNVQFARIATNIATRKRYGHLTYPIAAIEVLADHQPIEMDIRFDDLALPSNTKGQTRPVLLEQPIDFQCCALQVAVINAPIFGGQWQLSIPEANLQDQLLDVILVEDMGIEPARAIFERIINHQQNLTTQPKKRASENTYLQIAELTHIPGVHHVQTRAVEISTGEDPQDVTLDGEVRGQTPIRVSIAPQPLLVIVH